MNTGNKNLATDDVLALAKAILPGFRKSDDRTSPKAHPPMSDKDGGDVIALARKIGLSGFSRPPEPANSNTPEKR